MYIPKYAATDNLDLMKQLINDNGFGTLVHLSGNELSANHYPFLLSEENDELVLWTHMARSNPQWKELGTAQSLIVFTGPHSYISPSSYINPLNVPTWSYTAVHAQCSSEIIENIELEKKLMKELVDFYENKNQTNWDYNLPEDFHNKLLKAIVWIKFKVISIEGKFKLSQNRDEKDYESLFSILSAKPSNEELIKYMKLTRPKLE